MGCVLERWVRGGWSWRVGVLGGVFHEAALTALWQQGWRGQLRVPAVTLRVCGMLCGMLHGCAEMLGGSSKSQL